MSVTPYLDEFDADPETKRVLAVALEIIRVSLGLTDDLADGIIAKQIVELAKTGERHPDVLCESIEPMLQAMVRHSILKSTRGPGRLLACARATLHHGRREALSARPMKRTDRQSLSLRCSTAS